MKDCNNCSVFMCLDWTFLPSTLPTNKVWPGGGVGKNASNNNAACDCHFQLQTPQLRRCGGKMSIVIRQCVKSPSNKTDWLAGWLAGRESAVHLVVWCNFWIESWAITVNQPIAGTWEKGRPLWKIAVSVHALECCSNIAALHHILINPVPTWSGDFCCKLLYVLGFRELNLQSQKGKKHEAMIARGGRYEGPTALKNTPGGPVNRMDSIKKMAVIAASSGLQLAGCRECSRSCS